MASEEHQCHQPPHWNLSPALRSSERRSYENITYTESSITEIQRGKTGEHENLEWPVLCRHCAFVCLAIRPLDVSQGATTSHS